LASGLATPAQTADTLGKLLFAWRDEDTEIDRRLRMAELMTQSGQFRPALQMLRETGQTWPDRKDAIRTRLVATFDAALDPKLLPPLSSFDLVTLAEENADLVPDGAAGQALAARLSDRLTELDLPERAVPLLERLASSAPKGVARATFGGRLAAARLELNDPMGAVQALTATSADALPLALLESRTLTFAASVAAQHDLPSAEQALRDLDTAAGDELMARLREEAKDWPGAVSAWTRVVARTVPADGMLNAAQAATLVRLAAAAAQAGDDATLERLRAQAATRLPPGKMADTFNLLTAQPVRTASDLPRAARDVTLIRAVPAALAAMTVPPERLPALP
jgi:hypothetical protein